jgi:hypothetical protein
MNLAQSTGPCVVRKGTSFAITIAVAALLVCVGRLQAGSIYVPNGSFELPDTTYGSPDNDFWQESPTPFFWDEMVYGPWVYLAGVFENDTNGSPVHIYNIDGQQGAYLFAQPTVALFQDYDSIYGTNSNALHDFDAKYEIGKSYHLTVGVIGNGGGMSNGVTMELSLYYRDGTNLVTVGATTVTNSDVVFGGRTNFMDYSVHIPAVRATDAWANKHIGIRFMSTEFVHPYGYWDLDNVRLTDKIEIPNASFERPDTTFGSPDNDFWQESPTPFFWDEMVYGPWVYLAGVFENDTNGSPVHIYNIDGQQGAYLFAQPTVALFQDYDTIYGTNTTPLHDFDLTYEVGRSYHMTVGVIGNGGGMSNGVTMELSLYYRDGTNTPTVRATTVVNSAAVFGGRTNFIDYSVHTPAVKATDPWAGKKLGIRFMSTEFVHPYGYWDLDNVRLDDIQEPAFKALIRTNNQTQFTLCSEPGAKFEILGTTNIALPVANWSSIAIVTNASGAMRFTDPATGFGQRFYRARQLP